MRYFSAILCILLLLLAVPTVNASISTWSCSDDSDGAIVMTSPALINNGGGDYDLTMNCAQSWYPGHLQGDFTTDGDPTVRILEDITNDTSFDWTDYHITIGMTQSFSILGTGLATPDAGWTVSIVAPVAGYLPNTNNTVSGYVGTINYYQSAGNPVAMGDDGLFGFKISFTGSTNFTTEQIPTPEPATIILLGLGAVSVIKRRRV